MNRKLFNLVIILLILSSGIIQAQNRVRYTAIPKEGYRFVAWEDGNNENPLIVSLPIPDSLKTISVSMPVTSRIIRLSDQIFTSTQGVVKQEILDDASGEVVTLMSYSVDIYPLKAYFTISGNLQTDGDDLVLDTIYPCDPSQHVEFTFKHVPKGNVTIDSKTFTTTYDYYMTETEITQEQWKYVMGCNNNPSNWSNSIFLPVEQVSWYATLVFCNKLSGKLGLKRVYSISGDTNEANWGSIPTSNNNTWNAVVCDWDANGVRLPTEVEWMHAAKEGSNSSYDFSGSNTVGDVAWYRPPWSFNNKTHEVKGKDANYLGIYDMTGNVFEWCWDWYGDIPSNGQTNYRGPASGNSRVNKGGCFNSRDGQYLLGNYDDAHLYKRNYNNPQATSSERGFRVVVQNPSY